MQALINFPAHMQECQREDERLTGSPPPPHLQLPHHPLREDGEQKGGGPEKKAFKPPLSGAAAKFTGALFDEQPARTDKENRGTVGSPQRAAGECGRRGCCK